MCVCMHACAYDNGADYVFQVNDDTEILTVVCMYVYVCMCMYVCMYCILARVFDHGETMCVCVYVCIYVCMYACMCL